MSSYYSVDYCGTTEQKITHEYLVEAVLCRGNRGSAIRTGMARTDAHGWPAQARNGECPVKGSGCVAVGSLLAAEPAVHEDHTQYLSQIPHRFWFWVPTDTRFGGKRGAPGLLYPYKACACQQHRMCCVCTYVHIRSNQFD